MHVAIVVPVYNERKNLAALLRHLESLHADPGAEVVLVDGESDDGSRETIRRSGLPWITAQRGRASQMNAGAAATGGDLLLFLHADTRLPERALEAVRDAARGAAHGFFHVRLESDRTLLRLVGRAISLRSRWSGIATGDQAIWIRRERFDQIGGYPPLPLFEDVELCRRLRALEAPAALPLSVRTSARRWERAGPWQTILRMWLLRAAYALGVAPARLARYYEIAR